MTLRNINVSPFQAGLVLGVGAAAVQAWFKVVPPLAYGVCMVCHPRDLFNWLASRLLGLSWDYSVASTNWPLLTAVGVVLGAWVAARQHRESGLRPARQRVAYFIYGFLVINFGLLLGSCPIRIVLLAAYGNLMGMVGLVAVIVGVVCGSLVLRWRARRAAARGAAA